MKPVDVEPLSEQRWSKIEAEVFSELDRTGALETATSKPVRTERRRLVGFAAACAVAATLVFIVWPEAQRSGSPLVRVQASLAPVEKRIGSAQIQVGPHAAAVVNGDDERGVLVALEHGEFVFAVAPRKKSAFVVQAGDTRVETQSARFKVFYLASQTRIEVSAGSVALSSQNKREQVSAGKSWQLVPTQTVPAAEPAPAAPAKARAPSATSETAATEIHADAGVTERSTRGRSHRAHLPNMKVNERAAEPVGVTPAVTPGEATRDSYERAARLEGSRPDEAAALYFELSQSTGPWAENALFALGRLELERRQSERGHATLRRYLARYPSGRNAEDARRLLQP